MKIEEEIKQEVFRSEQHKAHLNLLYTSSWIEMQQSALFKPYGLTLPQFNILRILRGQYPEPATVSLLIERMLDKTSNASRIVDRLVAKQLVTRNQCPNDRRTVDVLITQRGLELLQEMDKLEAGAGLKSLNEQEAQELNRLLDKVRTKR